MPFQWYKLITKTLIVLLKIVKPPKHPRLEWECPKNNFNCSVIILSLQA